MRGPFRFAFVLPPTAAGIVFAATTGVVFTGTVGDTRFEGQARPPAQSAARAQAETPTPRRQAENPRGKREEKENPAGGEAGALEGELAAVRRSTALLESQIELARGDKFYLVLDPATSDLGL
ncbi:MAG: hypothetical protein EHM24_28240, partial [Acidobacteria bacterium]